MSEDHKYHSVVNKNNNENCDSSRQKVWPPSGTYIVSTQGTKLRRAKIHDDISMKYDLEKRSLFCRKRLHKSRLGETVDDITSKYGLDSSNVCSGMIRKRETQSDNMNVSRLRSVHISSIWKVEGKCVGMYTLTPSSYFQLVNAFISWTKVEKYVIEFKH